MVPTRPTRMRRAYQRAVWSIRSVTAAAVIGLLVPACGQSVRTSRPAPSAGDTLVAATTAVDRFTITRTVLVVDNRHWTDVLLWVETPDRQLVRVGRASPGSTTRWNVTRFAQLVGGIRFAADPTGTRSGMASRIFSDRLTLARGDSATWILERDLRRSAIDVRRAAPSSSDAR